MPPNPVLQGAFDSGLRALLPPPLNAIVRRLERLNGRRGVAQLHH